jgi:DNA-binding MarR family transcriptional regulator
MSTLKDISYGRPAADRHSGPSPHRKKEAASPYDLDTAAACFGLLRIVTINDREMTKRHGITPHQYEAMLEIYFWGDPEPITVGGLARRLNIKHNSAVHIVNKLSNKGYVVRVPSQRDHRLMHLRLQAEGRALLYVLARADHERSSVVASRFVP